MDASTLLKDQNRDSAHRPKIRVPGDAPKKIKLITSNISSSKIIRSDSTKKGALDSRDVSGLAGAPQTTGGKLLLK